jgi:hypothetical protein
MGGTVCCCLGEGRNPEERLPLMGKGGSASNRSLPQSILASRPLPADTLLDPALKELMDDLSPGEDDNGTGPDREKFEQHWQGIED